MNSALVFVLAILASLVLGQLPDPNVPSEFSPQDEINLLVRSLECVKKCQGPPYFCPTVEALQNNNGPYFSSSAHESLCEYCLKKCPPYAGNIGPGLKQLPPVENIAEAAVCVESCQSPFSCPLIGEIEARYNEQDCEYEALQVCQDRNIPSFTLNKCIEEVKQTLESCRSPTSIERIEPCFGCILSCPAVLSIIIEFTPQLLPPGFDTRNCEEMCTDDGFCLTEQEKEDQRIEKEKNCNKCEYFKRICEKANYTYRLCERVVSYFCDKCDIVIGQSAGCEYCIDACESS